MRRERWSGWDWMLAGCAGMTAIGAFAMRGLNPAAATYYPYPAAFWPPFHAGVVMIGVAISAPAFLGAARKGMLARADERHPSMAPKAPDSVGVAR